MPRPEAHRRCGDGSAREVAGDPNVVTDLELVAGHRVKQIAE
jgi:hypothetical protein